MALNQSAFDGWTVVHIAAGAILGLMEVGRPLAYGLIVAVEIAEVTLRPVSDFFQESTANIATDLVVGVAAYEITVAAPKDKV